MFLIFVLLLVTGLVFFKLGVLTMLVALFELVAKVLFFGTGLFLLVWGGRWLVRRRRPVTIDLRR